MAEPWMKWTLLEASTKTISKIFQKVIGELSATVSHTLFSVFVIGLVQTIAGFIITQTRGKKIMSDSISVLGACWFGINATLCTVLSFIVFLLNGDMGVNTLIITLSIIPGALMDRFFFGYKLYTREWFGILLAIFAGYSVLGWPRLSDFLDLPLWIFLSFIIMFLVTINQGITQKIKDIDPFVKNFWGGLTTLILGILALKFFGSLDLMTDFSLPLQKLWLSSAIIALIIVSMWSFNLMSYKGGAHIAIKKLVMNGTYLISVMLFSVVIFNETLTLDKIMGAMFYLAAFILMDRKTWQAIFINKIQEVRNER